MTIGTGRIDIEKRPHMVVNRDYVSILAGCNLLDFDCLYYYADGTTIKQIKERKVIQLRIHTPDGVRSFYLKRHVPNQVGIWSVIGSFCSGKSLSPGMSEFENICDFRKSGIPTVVPVAAGERQIGCCRYESFLLTESFEPYVSLEEIIYKNPDKLRGPAGESRKTILIKAIANLAREMHDAGFNHRDFNATHVLVGPESTSGGVSLAVFDLQRMDRKKWLRWWWFIKIMAELYYSIPQSQLSEDNKILLYQIYKGSAKLTPFDRLQLKWIKMKTTKIAKHTAKIMRRRKQITQNHHVDKI